MALIDPFSILRPTTAGSVPAWGATSAVTLRRLGPGKFRATENGGFSLDQPLDVQFSSNVRSVGESVLKVRVTQSVNTPPLNGIPQSDSKHYAEIRCGYDISVLSPAQRRDLLFLAITAFYNAVDAMERGET